MKKIINSILSLVVVATVAVACSSNKTENVQSEAPATDSTEVVEPAAADSVAQPADSASVN